MNGCLFNTPAHDGRDVLPVRLSIRKDIQLACSGCRDHIAQSAYLRVVERRAFVRDSRPVWLRNLSAKVLDHGTVGR